MFFAACKLECQAEASMAGHQGKIVRQESLNIDATFDKKQKQAEIAKKMYFPLLLWTSHCLTG